MLLQLASLFAAIVSVLAAPNIVHNSPQPPLILRGGESEVPELTAVSSFLVDTTSGTILHAKNADREVPMASITKLMTAFTLLDRIKDSPSREGLSFDRRITFEARDRRNGGIPYLIPGEEVSVREAWQLMLVGSSNDAAALLTRIAAGEEEQFVAAMNEKTRALGLKHTVFTDSTGLQAGNVSTARETAAFARAALTQAEIRDTVRLRRLAINPRGKAPRLVYSTNWLLGSFGLGAEEVFGGKTGHIKESGYNLVFAAGKGGRELIGVVLGSTDNNARFEDMSKLLKWGFENVK